MLQKKFVVETTKETHADSSAHCKIFGGALALPESAEENQQLLQAIGKSLELSLRFLISLPSTALILSASIFPLVFTLLKSIKSFFNCDIHLTHN